MNKFVSFARATSIALSNWVAEYRKYTRNKNGGGKRNYGLGKMKSNRFSGSEYFIKFEENCIALYKMVYSPNVRQGVTTVFQVAALVLLQIGHAAAITLHFAAR
jgi:hypothetical protein